VPAPVPAPAPAPRPKILIPGVGVVAGFLNMLDRRNEAAEITGVTIAAYRTGSAHVVALHAGYFSRRARLERAAELREAIAADPRVRRTVRAGGVRRPVHPYAVDWTRLVLDLLRQAHDASPIEAVCAVVRTSDGAVRLFSDGSWTPAAIALASRLLHEVAYGEQGVWFADERID